MKTCPECGGEVIVKKEGSWEFLAMCSMCGEFAAYETSIGIFPAKMRLRNTAMRMWKSGLIVMPK